MKAPSILYIGLTPQSSHIPDHIDRAALAKALDQAVPDSVAAGFDTESYFFEPDEMDKFQDKLNEKHWDAVIIGMGLRGNPALTEHFERTVNVIREHDANIKLGFNSTPNDTAVAAKRLFPMVKPLAV
ncbi:hypothetical protein H072_8995 [Dactylellina haptotyla CBS 200.50]|uniref:Uncharacterized protein n=1 Tax=Dactylellina haptotyla (strain CBS 200.50) TaxID=1284197 RepID=S8BDQ9_DACHA|nr:hypothetical protein H072_8995 [Dactylellina haptotyla CBS 200.50]